MSRGWLRSLPGRNRRERRYLRAEVEALRDRSEAGRGHRAVATRAIGWGHPVIDTTISAITPAGPAYRGLPAHRALARGFDATCAHLWRRPRFPAPRVCWSPAPGQVEAPPIARLSAFVAGLSLEAPPTGTVSDQAPAFLRRCALALVPRCRAPAAEAARTTAEVVAIALDQPEAAAALDVALVWCADHGLNASTFAARVAASTGAGLPAVVGAGLAALSGPKHGTASAGVQAFFDRIAQECDGDFGPALATREVVTELRARKQAPPGLGHPLYPGGDPRGQDLVRRARSREADGFIAAVADTLATLGCPAPDLDFGLVAHTRALRLPDRAPPMLFALGRMAGWMAHMIEERERGQLIRPRSRYVGPPIR